MKTSLEKRLRDRIAGKPVARKTDPNAERLASVAIERDGKVHDGLKSHYELRCSLGDENPAKSGPMDNEGFMTSRGRFVSREEARLVGVASGQLSPGWAQAGRKLLSSDINW